MFGFAWLTIAPDHPGGRLRPWHTDNCHDWFAGFSVADVRVAADRAKKALPRMRKNIRPEVVAILPGEEVK